MSTKQKTGSRASVILEFQSVIPSKSTARRFLFLYPFCQLAGTDGKHGDKTQQLGQREGYEAILDALLCQQFKPGAEEIRQAKCAK